MFQPAGLSGTGLEKITLHPGLDLGVRILQGGHAMRSKPSKIVDPVKVKQKEIRRAKKRKNAESLSRWTPKGFTRAQIIEIDNDSDMNMLYFYRREILEAHLTGRNYKRVPLRVRKRLRSLGMTGRSVILTPKGLELFKRNGWLVYES